MPSVLRAAGAEGFALVRDFASIVSVAEAAVVLFRRFNQPPFLGYLITGSAVSIGIVGIRAGVAAFLIWGPSGKFARWLPMGSSIRRLTIVIQGFLPGLSGPTEFGPDRK